MMYGTVTAKDGLKLRKAPSAKSVALDLMPFGDRVEIIGQAASVGWDRVVWLPAKGARLEGWAAAEYIRLDAPKPRPAPESEASIAWGAIVVIVFAVAMAAALIYMGLR